MVEFACGVWMGMCMTLVVLVVLGIMSNADDEGEDEWDPWGGRYGRG